MIIKKIIALTLIGGSAIFAFLIFQENRPAPIAIQPLAENKSEALPSELISNAKNATEEIAKNIAEEIIKQNPEGLLDTDAGKAINAMDPQRLADEVLSKQIAEMDLSDFSPEIKKSDLKIVNTSDSAVAENYLKNFQAILKNNFGRLGVDFSQPTAADFQKLAEAFQKSVAQFYNLVAPQSLASIHSEQIRLMSIQKSIFANLASYEKDPMKALVALQLSKEVDLKLNELKNQIIAYITKNGLKI